MLTIKIHGESTSDTISLHRAYGIPCVGDTLNLECSTGIKKQFIQLKIIDRIFTYHDVKGHMPACDEVSFMEQDVTLVCVRVGS
jgi:hypothetical protein